MKVFSQVSTIPGGHVKQKLVLCCSYKRTAAQYSAISLLSLKTLPSVTKPPGVGQVSHRQWASGQSGHTYKGNSGPSGFVEIDVAPPVPRVGEQTSYRELGSRRIS